MKKYEKPVLTAISLKGNEQLCGSCAYKLKDDISKATWILRTSGFGFGENGIVDGTDFIGMFGNAENDCSKKFDGYCKYSSVSEEGYLVAWS